jgi:uncharacterized protein YecE (DUF72 family)
LYRSWRGTFYPSGLRQKDELAWASRHVTSIEINGTFYSLQRPSCFRAWRAETPDGFVFPIKGSRFITHMKKLRDVETALANFFASGVLALREKLGPVLWQFPASMPFDLARFEAFLELLPKTTTAAARLARRHDERVAGRSYVRAPVDLPLRHAVEVRHHAFFASSFLTLLERHDVAFVVSDGAGRWPYAEHVTARFVYVRLHGAEELYVSGYRPADLDRWRDRCQAWLRSGRDVYVYFDNDAKVHAPFNAIALMDRLGVKLSVRELPDLKGRRDAPVGGPDIIVPPRVDPRWALGRIALSSVRRRRTRSG